MGALVRSSVAAAAAGAFLIGVGALPAAASASSLPWHSPNRVVSGVPVAVSSIASCPPVPTPGDQLLVEVDITFPGGGMGNVLPANADGSWSGQLTFNFSGTPRQATISASCEDFNGVFATAYAQYQSRHTQLVPS